MGNSSPKTPSRIPGSRGKKEFLDMVLNSANMGGPADRSSRLWAQRIPGTGSAELTSESPSRARRDEQTIRYGNSFSGTGDGSTSSGYSGLGKHRRSAIPGLKPRAQCL